MLTVILATFSLTLSHAFSFCLAFTARSVLPWGGLIHQYDNRLLGISGASMKVCCSCIFGTRALLPLADSNDIFQPIQLVE